MAPSIHKPNTDTDTINTWIEIQYPLCFSTLRILNMEACFPFILCCNMNAKEWKLFLKRKEKQIEFAFSCRERLENRDWRRTNQTCRCAAAHSVTSTQDQDSKILKASLSFPVLLYHLWTIKSMLVFTVKCVFYLVRQNLHLPLEYRLSFFLAEHKDGRLLRLWIIPASWL